MYVLVQDPDAEAKWYWTGDSWSPYRRRAKEYKNHDGERDVVYVRTIGSPKATLIPRDQLGANHG